MLFSRMRKIHLSAKAKRNPEKCVLNIHEQKYIEYPNFRKDYVGYAMMFQIAGMKLNSRLTQELFKKSVNNYPVYVDPYVTYTLIMEQFPGLPIDDFNEMLSRKGSFFMLIFEKCK